MAKRFYTTKGDMFSAKIDKKNKRYFQFITSDQSQLDSNVIRVFKKIYSLEDKPPLIDIIQDEVLFHTHCVVLCGLQDGSWEKEGHLKEVKPFDQVLFRTFSDLSFDFRTMTLVKVNSWALWHINGKRTFVQKLEGEHRNAELGSVFPTDIVMQQIRTGVYPYPYEGYEMPN